jgi:hypothetical protein
LKVLVKRADWNKETILDKTFNLVHGLSVGKKGLFVTVDASGVEGSERYPQRNFRVFINGPEDIQVEDPQAFELEVRTRYPGTRDTRVRKFYGAQHNHLSHMLVDPVPVVGKENDDEIRERITERFSILQSLTRDIARGDLKGLVVSGASGVGKSFEVEAALNRDSLIDKLGFNPDATDQDQRRISRDNRFKPRYSIVKGYSTAPALYMTLFEYSEARETLVFDDCDSVLGDETSLNILKAALDTTGKRTISWRSQSRNSTDAPNSFEFKGSVIFITNINFESIIDKGTARLAPHLDAIMSRCLYLDLTIETVKEKLVRINHVARDLRMLENEFKLSPDQIEDVMTWTHDNARRFRELSLRKVGQLASLRRGNPNWSRVAEVTLLKQR